MGREATMLSTIPEAEQILLGMPVLSTEWAHRLARAVQKARSADAGTHLSEEAFRALSGMLCSADPESSVAERLCQAMLASVHGSEVGRRSADAEGALLPQALLRIMADGTSRGRSHAAGALSQMVLAGPSATACCCELPGFLQGLTMHCVHGEDSDKNQAAILVNNCAAVGGPMVCENMAMHSGLIGALKSLLLHGEEPQRSRAAGAFMLLSHSSAARKHLLRGGVADSLELVALEMCEGTEQSLMLRSISSMALCNITADQPSRAALHEAILPVVVEFLEAAVASRPLHGMLWRPDDAMWTLQALSEMAAYRPFFLDTRALECMTALLSAQSTSSMLHPIGASCESLVLDTLTSLSSCRVCLPRLKALGISRIIQALPSRGASSGGWDVDGCVVAEKRRRLACVLQGEAEARRRLREVVGACRGLRGELEALPDRAKGIAALLGAGEAAHDNLAEEARAACEWVLRAVLPMGSTAKGTSILREAMVTWRCARFERVRLERLGDRLRRHAGRALVGGCFREWDAAVRGPGEGDALGGSGKEAQVLDEERMEQEEREREEARAGARVSGTVTAAVCGLVDHLVGEGKGDSAKEAMYAAIMQGIAEAIRDSQGSGASPRKDVSPRVLAGGGDKENVFRRASKPLGELERRHLAVRKMVQKA